MEGFRVQILGSEHDRSSFSCGIEVMDRYLREQANQDQKRGVAVVYVLENQGCVAGYYTLSSRSLCIGEWPPPVQKKLPRYPHVPATLLGRLAVDGGFKGRGLGEFLLMDAFEKALQASEQVASHALVVDVLEVDPDPLGFYLRYGFEAFPDHPRRLFLPLQTIRRAWGGRSRRPATK